MFFSWLAAQSYSIEVAIGVLFMVVIAPVMLAGMAGLASWAEQAVGELLQMSGMFDLSTKRPAQWRVAERGSRHRDTRLNFAWRCCVALTRSVAASGSSGVCAFMAATSQRATLASKAAILRRVATVVLPLLVFFIVWSPAWSRYATERENVGDRAGERRCSPKHFLRVSRR
jgi:hypothetical protein